MKDFNKFFIDMLQVHQSFFNFSGTFTGKVDFLGFHTFFTVKLNYFDEELKNKFTVDVQFTQSKLCKHVH